MTKNFEFVENFHNDYLKFCLDEIEKKINEDNFPFYSKLHEITKLAFTLVLPKHIRFSEAKIFNKNELNSNELFECIKKEYKSHNNSKHFDCKVEAAFEQINLANYRGEKKDSSHALQNAKRTMLIERIALLRNIHIILVFLNNNWLIASSYHVDDNDFQENLYHKEMIKVESKYNDNLIDVSKISIGELVLSPRIGFDIPTYQRNYCWSEDNVNDLIKGIYDNYRSNCESQFFGTIATTTKSDEFLKIKLIDGQQRVTTSLIIFKAIYHKMLEKNLGQQIENIPLELSSQFQKDINGNCPKSLEIKINKRGSYLVEDRELVAFRELMTSGPTKKELEGLSPHKNTNVVKNYISICDFLERNLSTFGELKKFYTYFNSSYILAKVDFKKNLNQEMEIFQNLNSKGMYLGILDLIKNAIFLKIDLELFSNKEKEIISTFSKTIDLTNKINFKKPNLISNKQKINNLELEFFYDYLAIRTKRLNHKEEARDLLRTFDLEILSQFNKIYDLDEYRKFSHEIGRYVEIFLDVRVFQEYNNSNYYIHDLANELNLFNTKKSLMPILFYLLDIYANSDWVEDNLRMSIDDQDKINLQRCLLEVEKWILAIVQTKGGQSPMQSIIGLINFLIKREMDSNFKKNLPHLIRDWLSGKRGGKSENEANSPYITLDSQTPSRKDFYDALTSRPIKKTLQETFAKRLEMHAFNKGSNEKEIFLKSGSIEHIIPQKIKNTEWLQYLTITQKQISVNNIYSIHEEKKDKLGNLLWIPKSLNSSLSNKGFEFKRNCYYQNNIAATKLTIEGETNSNLLNVDRFDYGILEKRTESLANLLLDIYNYND